jgi:hypothetical protein
MMSCRTCKADSVGEEEKGRQIQTDRIRKQTKRRNFSYKYYAASTNGENEDFIASLL